MINILYSVRRREEKMAAREGQANQDHPEEKEEEEKVDENGDIKRVKTKGEMFAEYLKKTFTDEDSTTDNQSANNDGNSSIIVKKSVIDHLEENDECLANLEQKEDRDAYQENTESTHQVAMGMSAITAETKTSDEKNNFEDNLDEKQVFNENKDENHIVDEIWEEPTDEKKADTDDNESKLGHEDKDNSNQDDDMVESFDKTKQCMGDQDGIKIEEEYNTKIEDEFEQDRKVMNEMINISQKSDKKEDQDVNESKLEHEVEDNSNQDDDLIESFDKTMQCMADQDGIKIEEEYTTKMEDEFDKPNAPLPVKIARESENYNQNNSGVEVLNDDEIDSDDDPDWVMIDNDKSESEEQELEVMNEMINISQESEKKEDQDHKTYNDKKVEITYNCDAFLERMNGIVNDDNDELGDVTYANEPNENSLVLNQNESFQESIGDEESIQSYDDADSEIADSIKINNSNHEELDILADDSKENLSQSTQASKDDDEISIEEVARDEPLEFTNQRVRSFLGSSEDLKDICVTNVTAVDAWERFKNSQHAPTTKDLDDIHPERFRRFKELEQLRPTGIFVPQD